jgi:hypothetical protein
VNLALKLRPSIRCSGSRDLQQQMQKMEATKFDFYRSDSFVAS